MSPIRLARGLWGSLAAGAALAFAAAACLNADTAAAQTADGDGARPATAQGMQPELRTVRAPILRGVVTTLPAAVVASHPAIRVLRPPSPLDDESANQRLERFRRMQALAERSGSPAPNGEPPAPEPVPTPEAPESRTPPAEAPETRPSDAPETQPVSKTLEERREEIRRRARERQERLRAAQGQPPAENGEPRANGTPAPAQAPSSEPAPVAPPAAPDGRTEWFSFVGMPWEDVVRHFAERMGKPLLTSDVIIGGSLDFQTPRRYTKEEAIDELNYLLVEQSYYLHETENYVYLLPLNELSKYIEPGYIFESLEAFSAAGLRDMQFAQVFVRIEDRPAEAIRDMLAPAMPDHALPVVVGETNSIKITGLARDVRRFEALLERFKTEKFDPRTMRIFEIKTRASDIEQMVRTLLGAEQPRRQFNRQTRQWETVGGDTGSDVRIIVDERTNTLIVKGTPAELQEVEEFINTLDKKKDIGEFKTHVIEVQHGNATEIRDLLNSIFQQERGQTTARPLTAAALRQRALQQRRQPQPQQVNPEEIFVEDIFEQARRTIRLEADERTNSLIVYANEDGVARVREMLEVLDRPVASNYRVFKIEQAGAEDIFPTVQQIAQGLGPAGPGRMGVRGPTVVLDAAAGALHVIAEREAMERIEMIIEELDVASAPDERHVVELRNLAPSRVAQMIQPLLQDGAQPVRRMPGRAAPGRVAPTSQVIPMDESNTLIVICSAEAWEKVEQIIRIADESAVSDRPVTEFYTLEHANPQSLAMTLGMLYRNYSYPGLPRTQVVVDVLDNQLVVQAIRPAQEEIAALIRQLDVPSTEQPIVILPLELADAQQVAEIALGLLPPEARAGPRGRRGPTDMMVQAEPVTNSLILKVDRQTLERIKAFAAEMEQQVAAQQPQRRFYTLHNAAPRDVVQAMSELLDVSTGMRRGGRGPVGTQVKAVVVGNQVVVDAPASKQAEIAALIEQLDELSDRGIVSMLVKLPGSNVQAIAQRLGSAFQDRVRQGSVARFEPDPSTETILVAVSKDLQEEADLLLEEYRAASAEIVTQTEFYQLRHAGAAEVAPWLREQLVTTMSKQFGRAAAEQVRITPDTRTNRVIISAPQVAVRSAVQLLEQFDLPMSVQEEAPPPPVVTDTRKLPGLDVSNLANQLNQMFRAQPPRPDRLQFAFGADRTTETLIFTVPKDSVGQVEEMIAKFVAETEGLQSEQRIFEVVNADANYIANQLRAILEVRIAGRYGRDMAGRVNIIPDARLNTVVVNAPGRAMEMAEALIEELDKQPVWGSQLTTIALTNADANAVLGVLNTIFREKIQARTLQVSAEPLTNSLIVGGSRQDVDEIRQWATELDTRSAETVSEPQIYELMNANPWEVFNVLQATFVQRAAGRRVPPGREIRINIVGGRSLVVQAPRDKLPEIEGLIKELDQVGRNEAVVRTYVLPGMGNNLNQLARQIQDAVNARLDQRDQRVTVTPVPASDALIVTALENQLSLVESAMDQFKTLNRPPQIETIALASADATLVAQALQKVLTDKIRAGRVQITPETMTNAIIVSANEEDMAEIRKWAGEFDQSVVLADNVMTIELTYANPNEAANMINQVFAAPRGTQRAPSQDVKVIVSGGRLIVTAPPARHESIRQLVSTIDAEVPDDVVVKMYNLKVMNATMVAVQVQAFLRSIFPNPRPGQLQPGAFAEPSTNTLVVLAPQDRIPFIDGLIAQIEASDRPVSEPKSYTLTNVRAEQVARNVEQMLRAKVTEQEGARAQGVQVAVVPEAATNRLLVMAPTDYQDLARELIRMIDEEVEAGDVVHIIRLEQSDAMQLVVTINQMLQGARSRQGGAPPRVIVAGDAGSNSIILTGLPKDIAEVERLVAELDAESATVPELQIFKLRHARALDVEETLGAIFPGGRSAADTVTVTADSYYNRLTVSANRRKMRQVEAFIEQLDAAPEIGETALPGDKDIYFVEVYRGDASDIAWDVSDYFPSPSRGGPDISADWFGEYIKVVCRPAEFPQIERLIREFDRRAKVEQKVRFLRPRGDIARLLPLLEAQQSNLLIEHAEQPAVPRTIVEDLWPEDEEPPRRESRPRGRTSRATPPPDVQPYMISPRILAEIEALRAQAAPQEEPKPAPPPAPAAERPARRAAQTQPGATDADEPLRREPVRITVLPDGRVAISGSRSQVNDVEDAISLLEEDMEAGEVIRIFRFRYGDVNAAARIVDQMFNEPQAMLRGQQQLQQQLQQLQQQQQQQRGRGGDDDAQGGLMEQLRGIMGGRGAGQPGQQQRGAAASGGQRIRLATDASHNYLIIKCDESLLPDIRELLRELDIPPAEVDVKVFQLRNLDAAETAANIKDVLGLSKARTSARQQPLGGAARAGQQGQLLELLQQQMVSMSGVEGGSAKIELVEVVSNQITNSLLVSAPPDVMEIIENVIDQLEDLEGRDVTVIRHRPLSTARVDDVLPLLQEIFAGTATAGRGPRGGSPADLGPVTISGDPRSNALIYSCQAKDVKTVEDQIAMLDIEGSIAEAETYVCEFGDAQAIAQAVSEVFARGAAGAPGRRAQAGGAGEIRITAEPGTNTIIVWGPMEQRDLIFQKVEELDKLSRREIREIPVIYANPERLAERLSQMFGGAVVAAADAGRGPRGARGQMLGTSGRIVLVGDKNAMKLLVRAPDAVFEQMKELVELLDQPNEQLQIRNFTLRHADAAIVVDSVKTAMLEYMTMARQQGGDTDFDAFTAVADPRTNSVLVVGSNETFAFVQQVLQTVDIATPAEKQKHFRIFVLDTADATTVADAINAFAAGADVAAAGRRTGGPRGPGAAGGAMSARQLDVSAVADPTNNSVLVHGRPEDIDRIESEVIAKLDRALSDHKEIATIAVQNALPTQVVSFVQQFLDDAIRTQPGARAGAAGPTPPTIIPNDNAGKIVVYGSRSQIARVQNLVLEFDNRELVEDTVKIVKVPYGQDAVALAQTVERLVNEGERIRAQAARRDPRLVTVTADSYTNALMVYGSSTQYGIVETVVQQLGDIRADRPSTRIIQLTNLSAQDAQTLIEDLQRRRGGGARPAGGTTTPGFRPGGTTPQRGTQQPPRRPRGGSLLWERDRELREAVPGARPGGTPFIASVVLTPGLGSVLAHQAATAGQPAPEPEPEPQQPPMTLPAGEVAMLSSVSGELRGDVSALPLDSRQIIITGDEEDVEFIVAMLALMDAATPRGQIEVFVLEHAKAPAIGPIVEQTLRAWVQQKSGGLDRGDQFSIIAEGRSNSLIVMASEPNLELVREIISRMDIDTMIGTEFAAIALDHIRASEAINILRPVIERLNAQRQVPSEAQASLQAIDRTNSLLVVGTSADISEIKRMIEGVDVELPPEQSFTTARVVVVELRNALANALAETLNTLIEVERTGAAERGAGAQGGALVRKLLMETADGRELPPLDLDKPIRILPEKGKNALIVFSTPQNNDALTEIIGLFDQLPTGNEIDVKSFTLRHAAAETVAELVQRMFDDSKKTLQRAADMAASNFPRGEMPPLPPSVTARGLPYNVVVSADSRSNSVIVIGHEDSVLLAAGLIRQLDRPGDELNIQPFVIGLKNIPANKLKEQLDEMLSSRLDAIGSDANKARDSAILTPDERSNALIVLSTPEMFQMVSALATQLDQSSSYRAVDSRYRRLSYADAVKLQGLIQELFDRKQEAADRTETQTRDVLFVSADARSNSLMLTGTRDYLREAEELLDQLDQAFDPTVEFKVRAVRLNSAANIATLLTDMIDKSRSEQDQKLRGSPIHVSADLYSNSLLLAASKEDMIMLERWITVLDKPSEPGRITRIIPMRRGRAEELSQRAAELFAAQRQGATADVTVTFDATTNSVVAIGPPAVVRDIEDFVSKVDSTDALSNAVVRIFKLTQADARDAGDLLRSVLEGRGGSVGGGTTTGTAGQTDALKQIMLIHQRQHPELGVETLRGMRAEITVIDDVRTNSLVVTASPESMGLVESLVTAIDVPPEAAKIRVFPLRNSDATEMAETLRTLFEESTRTQTTTTRTGDQQERVLALGEGPGPGGRQQLTFTTDLRTNAIIAAGTPGYLDLVEELILELDSQPIQPRKTLVYAPRNTGAVAIQQAISDYNDREKQVLDELGAEISASRKLERNIQAVASEDTNRIILNYDARREQEVLDLVRELDQPPPQVMIQVLIVEVTMDNRLELGVEFAFQDLQFTKAGPGDTTTFDYVGGTDIGAVGAGLGGFTFTITGQDFNFLLRTLQSEGSLNVLSRPQIVAMDNQEARIEITRDVPYPSGTATVAGQTTTTVARQDVGIILQVTPQINPDGFVRMEIRQEVSDLTGSTVDVGPGVTAPIFFKREAETVVTVRDNETVVLGGLITRRDETREQKVPFVGDIPILGLLFRNDVTMSERTELLVILTPRVIRTVEDFREISVQERDTAKVIPPDFLTDPLMKGLRVNPEDLAPMEERIMLAPFPDVPPAEPRPISEDEYGPVRPKPRTERGSTTESYDVPLTRAAAAAIAARNGALRE